MSLKKGELLAFSANTPTHADPEYWWQQAGQSEDVARLLAEHYREKEAFKRDLCDKCHAVLERELKAILAQRNLLTEGFQKTHNLNKLLEPLPDIQITKQQEDFLFWFATMHVQATYPDEEENLLVWNSDERMANMLVRYNELHKLFQSKRIQ